MYMIVALVKRNLLRFFRDKMTVFFSLLSVLILIALYVVFLAGVQADTIVRMVAENSGGALSLPNSDANAFVNTWLMSGIILTAVVNTVLTSTQFYVKDIEQGISKDITLTPMPKLKLVASYMLSTFITSGILTSTIFVTYLGVLALMRVPFMGVGNLLLSQAILHLTVFSFTAFISYMVSFLKTSSALSAVCTIVGVFTGFFAGIYLPMGSFPVVMQNALGMLPFAHSASLLRSVLMQGSLQNVFLNAEMATSLSKYYGIEVYVFNTFLPAWVSAVYLLVMGIVFFFLNITRMRKKL